MEERERVGLKVTAVWRGESGVEGYCDVEGRESLPVICFCLGEP